MCCVLAGLYTTPMRWIRGLNSLSSCTASLTRNVEIDAGNVFSPFVDNSSGVENHRVNGLKGAFLGNHLQRWSTPA